MQIVKIGNYQVGDGKKLMLMAGPCVLEGYERSLAIGKRVVKITSLEMLVLIMISIIKTAIGIGTTNGLFLTV